MSTFTRPSSPTKNRSNVRSITPTRSRSNSISSGSSSSINQSSSSKVLEEIHLLLHLETLKRNRDNEIFLMQKVEEAYKLFEERRSKYFSLVAKYTLLVKLACTRKALLRNDLIKFSTESAHADAKNIKDKISSGSATDYISTTELNNFKKKLLQMEKYKNLPIRRSEFVDLQNAINTIQYSIEAIENLLKQSITQGLDYFTDTLDMMNYPNLLKEFETNKY